MAVINHARQTALLAEMRQMAAAAEARPQAPGLNAEARPAEFASMLEQMVNNVNEAQQQGAQMADKFVTGESQADLAEVMVAMQKARVHFETMLQVRNRLVTAYEEIMRMPV